MPGKVSIFFVLTEDKVQESLKNILISSGFDEADFGVFSYFGVSDPSKLKVVATFIRDMQPTSTVLIHRDRDFLSAENVKSWEESVRAMKVQPFVTAGRDIEDSLVRADFLVEKNPNLTELDASRLIGEAAEELRVDAIKVFMNGRVEAERKSGNTNPDLGLLAQEAANAVSKSLRESVKGKALLAKLRDRYRVEKGRNLMTRGTSACLSDPTLVNVRKLQK